MATVLLHPEVEKHLDSLPDDIEGRIRSKLADAGEDPAKALHSIARDVAEVTATATVYISKALTSLANGSLRSPGDSLRSPPEPSFARFTRSRGRRSRVPWPRYARPRCAGAERHTLLRSAQSGRGRSAPARRGSPFQSPRRAGVGQS